MPVNKNKAIRLEKLNDFFRKRHYTLDEIVAKINQSIEPETISKRQIQMDIDYMKSKDAEIVSVRNGKRIELQYKDPQYSFFGNKISDEEKQHLEDAIQIIKALSTFHLSSDLQAIFYKLTKLSFQQADEKSLIQFETYETKGYEYLEDIYNAVKAKIVLQINYQSFVNDAPKIFILHGHLLKEYRNRWYLVASIDGKEDITTFALDRMQGKIKALPIIYKPCAGFDADTYYSNTIGINRKANSLPQTIVLKVAKKQVAYFETQPFHHTQKILAIHEDGTAIMQYHLIINFELKQMLLYYSALVEVVEPLELKTLKL